MSSPGNQQLGELPHRAEQARFSIPAEKPRFLIVEDDIPIAMLMTSLLTRVGIETEAATTGQRALQMAADGHYALITLDLDLPDVSGFEVCRRLKENPLFHTPLFLSADDLPKKTGNVAMILEHRTLSPNHSAQKSLSDGFYLTSNKGK